LGEEFDDGFEVEGVFTCIEGGALDVAVGEELFCECVGDECHDRFLVFADRSGPVAAVRRPTP
jgi:hypothetical protein